MKKIAVVYISNTGNTQAMADTLVGAIGDRAEVEVFDLSSTSFPGPAGYDAVLFGSPAMGSEVLEEDTFEPMFASIEGDLKGVKVGLFGSYGWGDGQWMRDWEDRCKADGIDLVSGGVISQEAEEDHNASGLADLAEKILA